MKRCTRILFILLSLILFPWRILAEEYRSPSDGIQAMRYTEGSLSLETKQAPLERVLEALSRLAAVTIISDGPVEGRLTVRINELPLDTALRKILRGKDTSFVYVPQGNASSEPYQLKEVRVYVAEGGKGEGRRYTSSRKTPPPRSPAPRSAASRRKRATRSRDMDPHPSVPNIASRSEAQRALSDLMEGNLDGLAEIAERLREENPQVQDQIDQFMDSLQEARDRAEESGRPLPPLEGLGSIGTLMQQMLKGRGAPVPPELPGE
jgi:hypothetical protein